MKKETKSPPKNVKNVIKKALVYEFQNDFKVKPLVLKLPKWIHELKDDSEKMVYHLDEIKRLVAKINKGFKNRIK